MVLSGYQTAAQIVAELSLSEKSIAAAKVILTGFVVVFSMLFLLILIIKIYSAVIAGAQKAADKRAKKKERIMEPVSGESGVHIITKPAYITPPTVDDDEIPDEIVAVIAAAVAASMPSATPKIKSIKKANGKRSAWANAGIIDNTRPF